MSFEEQIMSADKIFCANWRLLFIHVMTGVFFFSIYISICNNGTSSLAAKDCLSFLWLWLSYSWHGTICINFGIFSLCEYLHAQHEKTALLLFKAGLKLL